MWSKIPRVFSTFCVILCAAVTLFTKQTLSQSLPPVSPEQAREAAWERVQIQVKAGHAPGWDGATLGEPTTLYDLTGTISAYLFPVTFEGEPRGYLTVAAADISNLVLEFATEGDSPLTLESSPMVQAVAEEYEFARERPLYLGLLSYAYSLKTQEGLQIVDLTNGSVVEIDSTQVMTPLISYASPSADLIVEKDQTITTLSYKLISGVPDWNQFWGSYGCYSGCSPTSGVNLLGYWDANGYDNLIYGSDWQGAVNEMRTYMGTYCESGLGWTSIGSISPGIVNYAQAHGYGFSSELWFSPSYDSYRSEIDANRPLIVGVSDSSTYGGGHTIVGVGYDTSGNYMIVHDNWGTTIENFYLQYGTGYSSIHMHPVSPDLTPPASYSALSGTLGSGGWYLSSVTVILGSTDNSGGSGVKLIQYSVDGGDWQTVNGSSASFTVSGSGSHTVRYKAQDNAGNWESARSTSFKIDVTAPSNPTTVNPGCTASNNVWQNTCSDANFTWSGAADAHSGVAGYQVYWGTSSSGTSTSWTSSASYNPGAVGNGISYLRVRTKDNAGNWSGWTTLFTLRYDATAPTGSMTLNNAAPVSYATLVHVNAAASDTTSSVAKMRLRDSGGAWGAWQSYSTDSLWLLPGPTGKTFQVEIQYQDAAGNVSSVYGDGIALNIYPDRPHSSQYRLVKSTLGASGIVRSSGNYRLQSTLGQPSMIGTMSSTGYRMTSGYWGAQYIAPEISRIYVPLIVRAR